MERDSITAFHAALNFLLKDKWGAQTRLAKELGISQGLANSMFLGKRSSSEKIRRKVATYLGYEYEDFLKLGHNILSNKERIVKKLPSNYQAIINDDLMMEMISDVVDRLIYIVNNDASKLEYIKAIVDLTCNEIQTKKKDAKKKKFA